MNRRRVTSRRTSNLIEQIEAMPLDRLLISQGFRLQPFRIPRGLTHGDLRLRLTWKKTIGAEVQTVRLTHHVTVPDRI